MLVCLRSFRPGQPVIVSRMQVGAGLQGQHEMFMCGGAEWQPFSKVTVKGGGPRIDGSGGPTAA